MIAFNGIARHALLAAAVLALHAPRRAAKPSNCRRH